MKNEKQMIDKLNAGINHAKELADRKERVIQMIKANIEASKKPIVKEGKVEATKDLIATIQKEISN